MTDAQVLERMAGDLRGLLEQKNVSQDIQVILGRRQIETTELFAVMADDRAGFRTMAENTLGLDPVNDSVTIAKLVVSWEASKLKLQVRSQQDAEASVDREPKQIQINDYLGVKRRFETQYYELRDEEVPSKNSLEDLADQMESGDWRAMSLKEIASRTDVESDSRWGSLTVGKAGSIKLKKSAVETPAPRDHEELRQKLKVLGHHFVFLRMLHPTRAELADMTPFTYATYADYLLSKRVARLQAEDEAGHVFHTPTLKQVLTYDFYVRKKQMELVAPGTTIAAALKEASSDPTVKERHFTTPLSVSAASQGAASHRSRSPKQGRASVAPPPQSSWTRPKGSKGKKGKGKGRGYHNLTPEGRQICYAYNSQHERCDGSCGRIHCCQICFGKHPAHMHSSETKKKGGDEADDPSTTRAA